MGGAATPPATGLGKAKDEGESHHAASNRDQTCRIHSWPLLHRSCARSHGPLGEGKAYPGYFDGVPCREKHQLPPRGFFPVPSAVSLFMLIEEAVLSAVANHGCIVRTLRVPSSWASFEHSMGRPGTTLCSPKKNGSIDKILMVPEKGEGGERGMGEWGYPARRCRRQHQGLSSSTPEPWQVD